MLKLNDDPSVSVSKHPLVFTCAPPITLFIFNSGFGTERLVFGSLEQQWNRHPPQLPRPQHYIVGS